MEKQQETSEPKRDVEVTEERLDQIAAELGKPLAPHVLKHLVTYNTAEGMM